MTKCIGKWKLKECDDKFDDYLKEIGIGFAQRQMGKLVTSYEEISQDGDTWTLNIRASIKRGSVSFKLGEEFDETTLDGRRVTSRFEIENECLVKYQKSREDGKPDAKITRERRDEHTLIMHFETMKTKAKRIYVQQDTTS